MTHDELMAHLSARPGCCANLRQAAAQEIERLKGTTMLIENRLTLAAAENPRSVLADLMLAAAQEIVTLRARNDEVNSVAHRALKDIGEYAYKFGYCGGTLSVIARGIGDPMRLAKSAMERVGE